MADSQTSVIKTEVKSFVTAVRKKADELNNAKFVAKENGKSLISDTEITRLVGMETGAQVNIVEGVSISGGAAATVDSSTKIATLDLSGYALKSELTTALNYKGSVDTFAQLPASGNSNGDVYNVKISGGTDRYGTAIKAGDNVAYVVAGDGDTLGSGWDVLGGTTDLSGYVETETGKALSTNDFTTAYKNALDTLISGSDFTFDNQDVLDVFDDTPAS